jgi:hypothetical protein
LNTIPGSWTGRDRFNTLISYYTWNNNLHGLTNNVNLFPPAVSFYHKSIPSMTLSLGLKCHSSFQCCMLTLNGQQVQSQKKTRSIIISDANSGTPALFP